MKQFRKYSSRIWSLISSVITSPGEAVYQVGKLSYRLDAARFIRFYQERGKNTEASSSGNTGSLKSYFDNHHEGHGIWKWEHYFEIYERHFAKFQQKQLNLLEIGIYSGGSLEMWRAYFGDRCHIFGVDIEPACRSYESSYVTVHIGDQADRKFWGAFRESAPAIDIIIDDGGHTPEQQRVTLEEMLPHLKCGGVYLCEDVHGRHNGFASYAAKFAEELNGFGALNPIQKSIHSVHYYPYCVVIEKHPVAPESFSAPKRGTIWQPFFEVGTAPKKGI